MLCVFLPFYIRTSNVLTTEFCRNGFVLFGLRVAKAAHSASNGSDTPDVVIRLAGDGETCDGAGELMADDEPVEDEWSTPVWKGLRGGMAGKLVAGTGGGGVLAAKTGVSGGDPSDWDRVCDPMVGGRRGGSEVGPCDVTLAVKLPSHCSPRESFALLLSLLFN